MCTISGRVAVHQVLHASGSSPRSRSEGPAIRSYRRSGGVKTTPPGRRSFCIYPIMIA